MTLAEYLYVDHPRLDSYIEQFASLQTYDKVPTWKVGAALTGPKVEGTQTRHARPMTTHEKVAALTDYLKKGNDLGTSRWIWPRDDHGSPKWKAQPPTFAVETCGAVKVYIPATDDKRAGFAGLSLWLSEGSHSTNGVISDLALLEDFKKDDQPITRMGMEISAYTWLNWLLVDAELDKTIVYPTDIGDRVYQAPSLLDRGILEALEAVGCQVGTERRITTLYRIRDASFDTPTGMICAYPIYIIEA